MDQIITLSEDFMKNASISVLPDLPVVKWQTGKTHYEFTDYRYLNKTAFMFFAEILNEVLNNPGVERIVITYTDDMTDEDIELANETILATKFEAWKKTKGGFRIDGHFLVNGIQTKRDDKNKRKEGHYYVQDRTAAAIYRYGREHTGEMIKLEDLVEYCVDDSIKQLRLELGMEI